MSGNYEAFTDAELACGVRAGDPEAFAELGARYLRLIRGKAGLFEGSGVPEKEDLWQEGLLGLYQAASSFSETGGASFATYAGACVYRRMVTAARSYGSGKNRALNESLPLESLENAQAAQEGPEELFELQERFNVLREKVERTLSPLERRVLALYLSGYRRGEIPQLAGASQRACDNALQRIRGKWKNRKKLGV